MDLKYFLLYFSAIDPDLMRIPLSCLFEGFCLLLKPA